MVCRQDFDDQRKLVHCFAVDDQSETILSLLLLVAMPLNRSCVLRFFLSNSARTNLDLDCDRPHNTRPRKEAAAINTMAEVIFVLLLLVDFCRIWRL